ncbi:DUF1826 domain-containing protein [Flavobacterium sp.]|uniref:DUF1826 domain-containing protein n=1 Tax=Flavobacterium sp. TaxID=239 RepID=UPI00261F9F2B|nr:DUF1826 domain-containing protein [Flavobacterium sp.]
MNVAFPDHPQIAVVSSFLELTATEFEGTTNALCWHRRLEGDFEELVSKLTLQESVTEVSLEVLRALQLSVQGNLARAIILRDLQALTAIGAAPVLNLIRCYERDTDFDFIATDVYSFHVDRSPVATDTFLCTYHGAPSDLIANDQAVLKVEVPEIREQLKGLHQGTAAEFEDFLKDNYFDLHYQALPNAATVSLGTGHLWRLAVDHPTQAVLPCIHRAPVEADGGLRLLLIC